MMSRTLATLMALGLLQGCAHQEVNQALEEATQAHRLVSEDTEVLADAPRDVQRAQESLERARRFAGHLGSHEDALHYAYLSRRYSEIAAEHGQQAQNERRIEQLQKERERLRQTLQQARLLKMHQEGQWLEDQLISLAAAETDRGLVMTLGDVLFKPGSAELSVSAHHRLLKLAHFLHLNPARRVRIEGYTDNRGNAAENLALSHSRAQVVASFLEELGVEPGRMETVGYGEAFRVSENASARGRALNRRVEIVFSDAQGRLGKPRQ